MRRLVWLWLPAIGWMGLIFWLSSISHLRVSQGASDFLLRKTAHVTVYAVLFLLLYRALSDGEGWRWRWKWVIIAGVVAVVYGMSDEIHQAYVPGRGSHVTDVLIDSSGVLLGMGIGRWWVWWKEATGENNEEDSEYL